MGRIKQIKSLNVWMNGIIVGKWTLGREHSFQYNPEWISSPPARPLSLSMPLAGKERVYKGPLVEAYFENLLPDSEIIKKRIQSRFGIPSAAPFHLLSEIGRDCVGSIQLLPEDETPLDLKSIKGKIVGTDEIADILNSRFSPLRQNQNNQDFRISLAGAQEKTAFLYHQNKWMVPEGSTPTTHIFKQAMGIIASGEIDLSTSVENEWLCERILHHFGMETASSHIERFETEKVLVVKRFDRRLSMDKKWLMRLPQEDFCQALGTSAALKYESDGGPGIKEILATLNGSERAEKDRRAFFKSQILFFLLAAPDGHAKNFSIFLLPGGKFRITPMYDVLSLYPSMGKKANQIHPKRVRMAMGVQSSSGKIYNWDKISRRHWFYTAKANGISEKSCGDIMDEVLNKMPEVIKRIKKEIPVDFPQSVSSSILEGMVKCADRLRP